MENKCIINWDLHHKMLEKKYGNKINDSYDFNSLENEYLSLNKKVFSVQNISKLDDNTIMLESYLQDRKKYYVNTENFTLHTDIPTNDNNILSIMCEYLWVIKSISKYIINEESKIGGYKSLLTNLLSK